jgi:hypothetical protein
MCSFDTVSAMNAHQTTHFLSYLDQPPGGGRCINCPDARENAYRDPGVIGALGEN